MQRKSDFFFAFCSLIRTSDLRSKVGFISEEMKINMDLFCISLVLDKFLTLKKANIFAFSSLNRNFALSLHPNFK